MVTLINIEKLHRHKVRNHITYNAMIKTCKVKRWKNDNDKRHALYWIVGLSAMDSMTFKQYMKKILNLESRKWHQAVECITMHSFALVQVRGMTYELLSLISL